MATLGSRFAAPWRFVLPPALALAALAALEFRWIGEARDAERQRIESYLDASMSRFHEDLRGELVRVAGAFGGDPEISPANDWESYYRRKYETWVGVNRGPGLVAGLWFAASGTQPGDRAFRFDSASGRFQLATPETVPEALRAYSSLVDTSGRPRMRPRMPPFLWNVEDRPPLLVNAVMRFSREREQERRGRPELAGFVAVELSQDVMASQLLPALAARNFAGPDGYQFEVAVFSPASGGTPVFRSSPGSAMTVRSAADRADSLFAIPPGRAGDPGAMEEEGRRERFTPPDIVPGRTTGSWRILVRHPAGSLEAGVAKTYGRNLALSLGILALLAGAFAMILISTQRARRLARMQMDFVASVSHELRTPLAVIGSAGDNLAAGAVHGEQNTAQYGVMIRDEARRLATLVEQVLHYSAVEAGKQQLELQELPIGPLVQEAVAALKETAEAQGYTVEVRMEEDLPMVRVDPGALGQCLRNLVGNAVKYGGGAKWVGVGVSRRNGFQSGAVQISVEDRGMGIDHDELRHVFEPFYRGRNAVAAQIRGTGLGLSLVRDIVEGMGGKIKAESTPGKGSRFHVILPALEESALDEAQAP